mmetsp:Transcript_29778/g.98800  ORF Transcript_29778/g.98800 Transcript_29778/m.98800 type:complete len:257 (-) Transcript_29778:603-1373(-)
MHQVDDRRRVRRRRRADLALEALPEMGGRRLGVVAGLAHRREPRLGVLDGDDRARPSAAQQPLGVRPRRALLQRPTACGPAPSAAGGGYRGDTDDDVGGAVAPNEAVLRHAQRCRQLGVGLGPCVRRVLRGPASCGPECPPCVDRGAQHDAATGSTTGALLGASAAAAAAALAQAAVSQSNHSAMHLGCWQAQGVPQALGDGTSAAGGGGCGSEHVLADAHAKDRDVGANQLFREGLGVLLDKAAGQGPHGLPGRP